MKRDRSSFTLIEVIVAAVLITVGIGGGIAGYNVASERIEIAHLENALLAEITEVSEYFASLGLDAAEFQVEDGSPILHKDKENKGFDNERLGRFDTEIEYTVREKGTSDRPYKEITIKGTIDEKNISLVTKSIKVDTATPIHVEICVPNCPELWCGDDGCEGSCNCPSSHPVCGSNNWCSDSPPLDPDDDMFCVTSGPNAGTCDSSGTGNPCEDETDCEGDVPSDLCGNNDIDPGEECDPPGSLDGPFICNDECQWQLMPSTNSCTLQGTCEPWGTGDECTEDSQCCISDCPYLWCGDDGCEGSCNCPSSHPVCGSDNWCTQDSTCISDCPYLWCGDDGCEGSCNCPSSHPVCGSDNWCTQDSTCIPNCGECGSDGCGNRCPGNCAGWQDCIEEGGGGWGSGGGGGGRCLEICGSGHCDNLLCEYCARGSCQSYCEDGYTCSSGACVPTACSPSCAGKECGSDGCGGSCGTCLVGSCNGGNCEEPDLCAGVFCSYYDCMTCNSNTGNCEYKCGSWSCNDGSCESPPPDPYCGDGTCDSNESCSNCSADCGSCVCNANCTGKECGDDGCGGSCGTCSVGEYCDNGSCTELPFTIE